MKFIYIAVSFFLYCNSLTAQIPHSLIQKYLTELKDENILNVLKEFSGETSCYVGGKSTTIKNRVSKKGNDLAADYLKERLQSYGLTITDQVYSAGGRNIIAEQKGELYPDKKYIFGAHYDSMADYCADDNATGTAALLETAKILSKYKFKYTIVYGFWDEEEQGLIGSKNYARQIKINSVNVAGVLNMDMMGYDSNNDNKFEIHTKSGGSLALSDKLQAVNTGYQFGLVPIVKNPGTDRSDHAAFWEQGYNAIHFMEAFFTGDGSPFYHQSTDRISTLNLPYFYKICRLGMATIATLAEPLDANGIETQTTADKINLNTYPNPVTESLTIRYELPKTTPVHLSIHNSLGQSNEVLVNETESAGFNQHTISTEKLAAGIYFVVIKTEAQINYNKIVVAK